MINRISFNGNDVLILRRKDEVSGNKPFHYAVCPTLPPNSRYLSSLYDVEYMIDQDQQNYGVKENLFAFDLKSHGVDDSFYLMDQSCGQVSAFSGDPDQFRHGTAYILSRPLVRNIDRDKVSLGKAHEKSSLSPKDRFIDSVKTSLKRLDRELLD